MQPAPARLPAHLIVLFDSLSNVDFMSLTKRSLKDKVEILKNAVAAELAKHSASTHRHESQDVRGPAPVPKPDPPKSVPTKPVVRNGDRVPDRRRDGDRAAGTRPAPAAKNSGLKSAVSSAVPPPPKFSDLIRLAADRQQDGDMGTKSPSPSPVRNNNKNRRPSPDSRRRSSGNRSPDSRSESRSKQSDDRRQFGGRPDRRPDVTGHQQSRGRGNSFENGSTQRPAVRVASDASRNSSSSRPAPRPGDSRNYESEQHQNRQRTEEKRPSAKVRKKNEEEQLLERRKQRIREEEARVKLRNDVLAGKKGSADLKTLVTKSMGSTVLSCGRPAVPDSGNRQRDIYRNSHADGHGRGSVIPGHHARDRINSGDRHRRPPDRYYNDYDEDEDEEMDDFIDDDNNFIEDDTPDVSQHIREIFGYDKRKYADFDDDDIQESSYAEVQKEEMRSAKIGRKEDLEDMRMELMKKKEKRKHMARD